MNNAEPANNSLFMLILQNYLVVSIAHDLEECKQKITRLQLVFLYVIYKIWNSHIASVAQVM